MADFAGGADSGNAAVNGQSVEPQVTSTTPIEQTSSNQMSGGQSPANMAGQTPIHQGSQHGSQPDARFSGNQSFAGQAAASQSAASGHAPSVLEALRASGYDTTGFQDDRTFLDVVNKRLAAAEQYEKQIADYQRQLAAREQAPPADLAMERVQSHLSAPVESQPGWNPPAYDTRNDQYFQFDEQTKRWVPNRPNIPYELVQAKNDYMDYRAAFAKEWQENPVDTLWRRTEDRNRALVREELKQLFDQMQVTKNTSDWLNKHKNVLFVDGQVDYAGDPAKLTRAGQVAMQATEELDRANIHDPAVRLRYIEKSMAEDLAKRYVQQYQQQQHDPLKRMYSLPEVAQALIAATGMQLPPAAAPAMPPVQQYPAMPYQQAYQQAYQQPYPQPNPAYAAPGFVPQQGYLQPQQMPGMMPEQASQPRRFLGGVGHSSSAGVGGSPTGEFVPQPSGGKPNFMGIANQIAAARGIPL